MRVLIDTNVALDFMLERDGFYAQAKAVLKYCVSTVDGYIAVHSFPNIFYVLKNTMGFSLEETRSAIKKLCTVFNVASFDKQEILSAIDNADFADFEDALQLESAKLKNIDYIITRDDDFKNSTVKVLTPGEFVKMMGGEILLVGIKKNI